MIRAGDRRRCETVAASDDTAVEGSAEIKASGFAMLHKPVAADDLWHKLAQLLSSSGSPFSSHRSNR